MVKTRIKICGVTRVEDAQAITAAGAHAIGLVFYEPSPRSVSIEQAQNIQQSLPPFITTVGLFVNAEEDYIHSVLDKVHLDLMQFHGDESEADCLRYNKSYIKAVRMNADIDYAKQEQAYSSAKALLLDTYIAGQQGGTGEVFDWSIIPSHRTKPIILAGGLNAENVADGIKQVQPYAVDVSGGVESSKGIKDTQKVIEFINEVEHVRS